MSNQCTVRFSALDTWFFRESRPMEAIGGSELASVFPPPPRTLMGAMRASIGDSLNADWRAFGLAPGEYSLPSGISLKELIGDGDDCGPLAMAGPWLVNKDIRLYPVPLFLLERHEKTAKSYVRLSIGPAALTSLGKVRLPRLPPGNAGAKTVERVWVTQAGLASILNGDLPEMNAFYRAADLFMEEPRLGIARDNARRVAGEGMLYQTRHLRPNPSLAIEAEFTLPKTLNLDERLVRLGGEGRLAHLEFRPGVGDPLSVCNVTAEARGLILVLMTPARLGDGREGWLPPGFTASEPSGSRVWTGEIANTKLTLHAAVIGKSQREGGWNLAERTPRDVVSLIPAGSCYYVTHAGNLAEAVRKLHGARIGHDQELGRGQIACGLWNENEF